MFTDHCYMVHKPTQHETLFNACAIVLTGYDPAIQSAVLADLTASLLAGHFAFTDGESDGLRTEKMRKKLLKQHVDLVRQLIPINEARILEQQRRSAN